MNENITCICFDLGGVLVNFDLSRARDRIKSFTSFSNEKNEEILQNIFFKENALLDKGELDEKKYIPYIKEKYNLNATNDDLNIFLKDFFSENSPIVDLGLRLKKKYDVVLFSNTSWFHLNFILTSFPRLSFLDTYVVSSDFKIVKPHENYFKHACSRINREPANCLFIDDKKENVEAAKRFGMSAIHHTSNEATLDSIQSLGLLDSPEFF